MPSSLTMSYPETWVWQVSIQAPEGNEVRQQVEQLGYLLEVAAKENSEPAVFSIRMRSAGSV